MTKKVLTDDEIAARKCFVVDYKGKPAGANPSRATIEHLEKAGYERQPMAAVIRAKCLACKGGDSSAVALCVETGCPLWLYRFGKNPWRSLRLTAAERWDRMARLAEGRGASMRTPRPSDDE